MTSTLDILDGVMDLFKELIWDNLIKAALADLFVAVPLLGWGPIGVVITYLATQWSDRLYKGVKIFVDVQAIAIKNDILKSKYDEASVHLKIIAKSYGVLSPEFEEARNEKRKSLSQFVSYDIVRVS